MGGVNISAKFAKDEAEYDGLAAISGALIGDPMTRRVVVGVVETIRITEDLKADGRKTPTVRFVHVEALEGDDATQARELANKQYRRRTGRDEDPQMSLFDHDGDEDGNPRIGPSDAEIELATDEPGDE
jgi:hypothetical protein